MKKWSDPAEKIWNIYCTIEKNREQEKSEKKFKWRKESCEKFHELSCDLDAWKLERNRAEKLLKNEES